MRYISTRGRAPNLAFDEALLAGLATDGGLYVPESWPRLDMTALAGRPYAALATAVMEPLIAGAIDSETVKRLVTRAYNAFDHPAVTPLVQLDADFWLLELFHGPTLAFKDVALQLLGLLFDHVLQERGQRVTVIGATSGDTGSAAIEACRDRDAIDIFILHPKGRTSEVQRRQMTTVHSANVHNIAIDGDFDDCQDLVKAMFADPGLRAALGLTAVNSINWARIMAQAAYYVWCAVQLNARADRPLRFVVPTGNFGNIYAAYAARAMGVPIDRLVVASNKNDILHRLLDSGRMQREAVVPSLSPSMDIQISSNLERYLFDLFDRDGPRLEQAMTAFRASGDLSLTDVQWQAARDLFASARVEDDETLATIRAYWNSHGMAVDPHTAVGLTAANRLFADRSDGGIVVSLACAHPAKFPDAVEQATGYRPALPDRMAELFDREERVTDLPADLQQVVAHIRAHSRAGSGG